MKTFDKMKVTDELIFKFFRNEHSEEEADAINEWVKEKPENESEFHRLYKEFMLVEMLRATGADDEIRKSIEAKKARRKKIYRLSSIFAGIAASLAVGFLVSKQFIAKPAIDLIENSLAVQECQPGQHSSFTLSDGSVIHLNSNSKLEYPAIFHGGERRVKLDGEAVFDVAHDPEHPFVIETYAYDVKVLGTKFGVVADESTDEFSTTLLEGSVGIYQDAAEITVLKPNQRAVLTENGLRTETLDDAKSDLLWTDDLFFVGKSSFEDVIKRAERCYGVKLVIDRKEPLDQGFARLKVRISEGIGHLLQQLQKKSDFTYYYDDRDDTYHIE